MASRMGVSVFQREMDRMVDQYGLRATFPYLDNVTICGHDQQDHDANLQKFPGDGQLAENHANAFAEAGFKDIFGYRYWDSAKLGLATQQWLEDLENAPEYSIVVLHIAAHRPTATDPTPAVWRQIAEVMKVRGTKLFKGEVYPTEFLPNTKRKKHFPFFYVTAQGLATGDLNRDAWPVRHFVTERFELFCAQSFSKNFGLYNERVGSLTVVSRDNHTLIRIRSQMEKAARCAWSNPPRYGARIVATVLNNTSFFAEWQENLKGMAERLMLTKEKLKEELRILGTPGPWEHLTKQIGTYIYPGFTDSQIDYLRKKKHIYLSSSGQINISKVNSQNLTYLAHCIHEAVVSSPEDNES